MKRKVNRVGENTLTVSLPSKWVKKHHIKAGDEIELNETGRSLVLGKEYSPESEQGEVDVTGQKTMVHRIIGASYKAGYDEVAIKYSNPDELAIIQNRLERNLPEFDIADYKQGYVKVKSISMLDPEQFETVFKRSFFTVRDIATDSLKAITDKDYEGLKTIIIRDKSVDRYTDYCRRLLNKGVETKFKRPSCIYYLMEELEIIGDIYKDMCHEISEKKLVISPELTNLLKEVNNFLTEFSELVFGFSLEKIRTLGINREKLNKRIEEFFDKVSKKELKIFFLIAQIFNATFEMKSALLTEFV